MNAPVHGGLPRLVLLLLLLLLLLRGPLAAQEPADPDCHDADDDGHLGKCPHDPSHWNRTYELNGKNVTLGELSDYLEANRPNYYWDKVLKKTNGMVCQAKTSTLKCCPSYCCSVESTMHDVQQDSMDMGFRNTQTASMNGSFEILNWGDGTNGFPPGVFVMALYRDFDKALWGGWTVEVTFSKSIFDLHSFNAHVVGVTNKATTFYMQPEVWNKDIAQPGRRKLMIQGKTTLPALDGIPLTAQGALWYDPTQNGEAKPVDFPQEPRPVAAPAPTPGERYNLAEVLQLSTLFYEAQRSGKLPKNKRIPWRGDSGLKDGADVGKDLSGGWYDAGDFIKYHVPMAYSTIVLLWGLIRYQEAYEVAGQLDAMRDAVRWPLDYFLKTHTAPDELYVQVSDEVDHCNWGPPEKMEAKYRRSYKVTCNNPGSQPVMNTAAALAAGSIAFREVDPKYAQRLLHHAKQLYDFGERCPGDYIKDGTIPAFAQYNERHFNGNYTDEQALAAIWLHKATGDTAYLDKAEALWLECCAPEKGGEAPTRILSWMDMHQAVHVLLYELTHKPEYARSVQAHLDGFFATTPKFDSGFYKSNPWGMNRYTSNVALIALVAAEMGLKPDTYRHEAASQLNYLLGDCCGGNSSFVVGFSNNRNDTTWPRSYHHRAASCNGDKCSCTAFPFPHTLWGALLGNPEDDKPSRDGCPDFQSNEVACDYNAGWTSAIAALKQLSMEGMHF